MKHKGDNPTPVHRITDAEAYKFVCFALNGALKPIAIYQHSITKDLKAEVRK